MTAPFVANDGVEGYYGSGTGAMYSGIPIQERLQLLTSFRRVLLVLRKYQGRLVISQVLVMISALSIIGVQRS